MIRDYLGRRYEINKNDCLSLVCEFYDKELGIKIKKPKYNTAEDIYKYHVNDVLVNNLCKVPLDKLYSKDILVFSTKNKRNLLHLGIFFQPNKVLHIEKDGISKYEDISDFYWDRLVIALRGKDV